MANQPLTDAALAAQLDAAGRRAQVRTVQRYVGHNDVEYSSVEEAMLSFEQAALERYLFAHAHADIDPEGARAVAKLLRTKLCRHSRTDWLVLLEALEVEVNYDPDEN